MYYMTESVLVSISNKCLSNTYARGNQHDAHKHAWKTNLWSTFFIYSYLLSTTLFERLLYPIKYHLGKKLIILIPDLVQ